MLIRLTNKTTGFEGKMLAIESSIITAVYEGQVDKDLWTTFIFSHVVGQTWQVEESVDEILRLVDKE